jgi:hypothetical protein
MFTEVANFCGDVRCSAARTNVVLRIIMLTITVVSLVSSLPSLLLHDVFASRLLHITMLRNDYTVPTRCRHRGGIVDPPGCKACRAIRQPISPSNQILDHSIQNHPKPVSFLPSGVSSGSSLTPLNPTITHTQSPHLASITWLARFVIIDFFARNYNRTFCA